LVLDVTQQDGAAMFATEEGQTSTTHHANVSITMLLLVHKLCSNIQADNMPHNHK
jgi:hypothetical protein